MSQRIGENSGAVTARTVASLLVLVGLVVMMAKDHLTSPIAAQDRPNFVVILADDLDSAAVSHMPAVTRHLVESGTSFSRFFATTPLCCPSRVSMLRGQYTHNHRVLRNTGDDAGFEAFYKSGQETDTLATELDNAGYETALVGKYLNGYTSGRRTRHYVPPGWDFWVAGVDHDAYTGFGYTLNINGDLVAYGQEEADYMTDVLSNHALDFLDAAMTGDEPFFLLLAPYAPHSPSTPAPRHEGLLSGIGAPRTPAFNEDVQDKSTWVRTAGALRATKIADIDADYQRRVESLLAVDEMVDRVVQRLEQRELMDSTYILFLSDNGIFLGEHQQSHGKDAPYDAVCRIPLVIRGPGIAGNVSEDRIALNIDLFPTILDLAGLAPPAFVDGRSLKPVLKGDVRSWRSVALFEGFGKERETLAGDDSASPPFRALRSEEAMYVEYGTGEREFYNMLDDPYQLSNQIQTTSDEFLRQWSARLNALASCTGQECRRLEDEPLPSPS